MHSYIQSKLRPLPSSPTTQGFQDSGTLFTTALYVIVVDILSLFIFQILLDHIILFYIPITFKFTHGTFSRMDHILYHKTGFNEFKQIEIISSIFSNHDGMLEIHYRKKTRNNTNMWRLNNMLLNNQWVKEEIKQEPKIILKQ